MKFSSLKRCAAMPAVLAFSLFFSFSSMAAIDGRPESADTDCQEVSGLTGEEQGESLGMFTTTGYCSCELCSSGSGLTYSGDVPKPNHTISADINLFPIGTKLMIGGIIYTVEDIGSSVNSHKIDIYYGSHSEALAHGTQTQEVFRVAEQDT